LGPNIPPAESRRNLHDKVLTTTLMKAGVLWEDMPCLLEQLHTFRKYGSAMLIKYIPQPDNNALTQTIKFVCIKPLHVSTRSGEHPAYA